MKDKINLSDMVFLKWVCGNEIEVFIVTNEGKSREKTAANDFITFDCVWLPQRF